jgi:hypothetical protein
VIARELPATPSSGTHADWPLQRACTILARSGSIEVKSAHVLGARSCSSRATNASLPDSIETTSVMQILSS